MLNYFLPSVNSLSWDSFKLESLWSSEGKSSTGPGIGTVPPVALEQLGQELNTQAGEGGPDSGDVSSRCGSDSPEEVCVGSQNVLPSYYDALEEVSDHQDNVSEEDDEDDQQNAMEMDHCVAHLHELLKYERRAENEYGQEELGPTDKQDQEYIQERLNNVLHDYPHHDKQHRRHRNKHSTAGVLQHVISQDSTDTHKRQIKVSKSDRRDNRRPSVVLANPDGEELTYSAVKEKIKLCRGELGEVLTGGLPEDLQRQQEHPRGRHRHQDTPFEQLMRSEVRMYHGLMKERFEKLGVANADKERFTETTDITTVVKEGVLKYHQYCEQMGTFKEDTQPNGLDHKEREHLSQLISMMQGTSDESAQPQQRLPRDTKTSMRETKASMRDTCITPSSSRRKSCTSTPSSRARKSIGSTSSSQQVPEAAAPAGMPTSP